PGVAVGGAHDLVGDELLVLLDHRVVVAAADQALDREERLFRIGDRLALGRLADQPLAVVRERHDRRRGPHAFCVLDYLRRLAFHYGNARIGGAEVDADDLAHSLPSLCSRSDGPLQHPKGAPPGIANPVGTAPTPTPRSYTSRRPRRVQSSYRRVILGRKRGKQETGPISVGS